MRYVAIDPKPYLAAREYDVPSFIWNPMDNPLDDRDQLEDRISAFVAAGLDDVRIRAWTGIRGAYLRPAHAAQIAAGVGPVSVRPRVLLAEHLGTGAHRVPDRGGRGLGRRRRRPLHAQAPHAYREPIGVLQGALLGIVGLILAFGLTLAVGRYQDRRADVVIDANTIGTAYLRAQTIAEPQRTPRSHCFGATTTWRSASPRRFRGVRLCERRLRSRSSSSRGSGVLEARR